MELIILILILIVVSVVGSAIWVFCTPTSNNNKNNKKVNTRKSYHSNTDDDESDEDFLHEVVELNNTMKAVYGVFSSGKSSKEKRIEAKKKRLAELEKEHHWERSYDPAWDTGSYTGNDWDSEEERLGKQIGNLDQQNLSYGQWMDYEDRRTYKDESDPTEMPDEDEYGG